MRCVSTAIERIHPASKPIVCKSQCVCPRRFCCAATSFLDFLYRCKYIHIYIYIFVCGARIKEKGSKYPSSSFFFLLIHTKMRERKKKFYAQKKSDTIFNLFALLGYIEAKLVLLRVCDIILLVSTKELRWRQMDHKWIEKGGGGGGGGLNNSRIRNHFFASSMYFLFLLFPNLFMRC